MQEDYRAREIITKKWIYGDLVHNCADGFSRRIKVGIKASNCYPQEVVIGSECRKVGLKDINKKDIYYNSDIVEFELLISGTRYSPSSKWKTLSGSFDFSDEELRAEIDIDLKYGKDGYIVLSYNALTMKNFKIIGEKDI